MKSILISAVCMLFALMLNAQTQDSKRSLDKAKKQSGKNSTYPTEDVEENVFNRDNCAFCARNSFLLFNF